MERKSSSFNPYRVFKFVATAYDVISATIEKSFQSLSGFQVRCNTASGRALPGRLCWFQSLSGFQVRCNLPGRFNYTVSRAKVSIPIGFSSSLQHKTVTMNQRIAISFNPYRVFKFVATSGRDICGCDPCSVSIPIGFSSSLQRMCLSPTWPRRLSFQSLSGFQVRCNDFVEQSHTEQGQRFQSLSGFQVRCNNFFFAMPLCVRLCFNPYRVFKFVATMPSILRRPGHDPVSIPIGFSSSLQHWHKSPASLRCSKFQSLSGFQVRCNCRLCPSWEPRSGFQSLSGFQVRCNWCNAIWIIAISNVSIPIGFSSSLQLL